MSDLDLGTTLRGFAAGQKVFARFTLQRILGRGGMGVVWLAQDEELQRLVALKFLPEIVALDRESISELKRETRRNLELTHPHIVRIYDFVQDGRGAAISMEFIDGASLSALKPDQPHGVFPLGHVREWVRQLGAALSYAHESARVVHRDLKPANLMIDGSGRLKITDFGIAMSITDSVSRVSGRSGSSGTPLYMSPQQMMGDKPAPTDDVYSLGATLFELLTGKPPFHTGNILLQVQQKVPPSIAARRAELGIETADTLPAGWEETIARCLAKEAADRPPSIRAVLAGLGLGNEPVAVVIPPDATAAHQPPTPIAAPAAPMPAPAPPPPAAAAPTELPRAVPARRTRRLPRLAAGAVSLAALGGGGYFFLRPAPAPAPVREPVIHAAAPAADDPAAAQREAEAAAAALLAETRQRERDAIVARIGTASPALDAGTFAAIESAVAAYLAQAPDALRAEVSGLWSAQASAWHAARRPATLHLRTAPAGATVRIGDRTRPSPASFADLPPGAVTVEITQPGYHSRRLEFELGPAQVFEAPLITLEPVLQPVRLDAGPGRVNYRLSAPDGRAFDGPLPATLDLPAGRYGLVYSRPDYGTREAVLEVGAEPAVASADLSGVTLDLTTTPAGAAVTLNGQPLGATPLRVPDLKPGELRLEFSLKDHVPATLTRTGTLGGMIRESVTLVEDPLRVALRRLDGYWAYAGRMIGISSVLKISGADSQVEFRGRALWMNNSGNAPFTRYDQERNAPVAAFTPPGQTTPFMMFFETEGDGIAITYEVHKNRIKYRRATEAEIRKWFPEEAAAAGGR